jgi:hypothetical protein
MSRLGCVQRQLFEETPTTVALAVNDRARVIQLLATLLEELVQVPAHRNLGMETADEQAQR